MTCRLAGAALAQTFETLDFAFPEGIVALSAAQHEATALLECLSGLRPLQAGQYLWDDVDIYHQEAREALQSRRAMGCAFDHRGLLFGISLFENLQLPLLYHRHLKEEEADQRAREYLARVGLSAQSDLRPAQVTAAQRKLCALARSLITHPRLLAWDQPTSGLPREQSAQLAQWLREHCRQHGLRQVFLVSDDTDFLDALEASSVTLKDGRLR